MDNQAVKKSFGQFLRFAVIGAMNTGVDLIILNIETISTGIKEGTGYGIQKGLSFLVAVTFSYFLNKHWTFEDASRKNEGKKFSQFLSVSVIGMIINVTVATVTVTYLKAPINDFLNFNFLTDQIWVSLGGLAGTAVGLIWNFIGYKFWVFKK
ncbi:MAG: GtrA family protein [Candidatus Moranbacteria bacterium]|jgi:putative flippase GtrA|nr:GtrA family protein [Candidatus Moranbacteria bacterium]